MHCFSKLKSFLKAWWGLFSVSRMYNSKTDKDHIKSLKNRRDTCCYLTQCRILGGQVPETYEIIAWYSFGVFYGSGREGKTKEY